MTQKSEDYGIVVNVQNSDGSKTVGICTGGLTQNEAHAAKAQAEIGGAQAIVFNNNTKTS